jgi:gliding motility-associated-like protein
MKKWIDNLHILLVCVGFTTFSNAQPVNDNCGAATAITIGVGSCNSILYDNNLATSVGDPAIPACWSPASLSHTVWFSFVATTADIEISTNFGGTLANTQLAVYSGACGSLTQIACQENINTASGLLHTNVILHGLTVGNTYYLLVDGNGNTTGSFGICAQETLPVGPPLPTQDCVGAQSLCNLGNIVVPNGPGGTGASIEAPSCFGAPGERSSNWYTFTAATSGTLQFSITPNTPIDYDFAVYNTTSSCPGTELTCNWEMESGTGQTGLGCADILQCEPSLSVVAGQTYTILVDRYTAASTSGFTLSFAGTSASFTTPTPTFTATTACLGTATQFTNTTNGNYTYNWNFGDGFTSNLENPTHTYTASGPHSVTLLLTTVPGGCQNAATQVVNVTPLPTVDAGIGGSVCPGNCITLNGSTNATGSVGPTSFSNTADFNIPDGSIVGVSSPIVVSGVFPTVFAVGSIASVCLNIDHTFDGDLDIFLQAPDGTRIDLSSDNGGLGQDYINTCFSPTAVTAITAGAVPFTGSFLPEQSFNGLNGHNTNGTWQLFVQDDAGIDTGTIRDWTITFNNNLPAFTWSPTTAMTNSTTLSPNVCPSATTIYTLTANNGVGCSATDTVTVNYTASVPPVITCGITTPTSVQFDWSALFGATSYVISYQIGAGPVVNVGNIGNLLSCTVNGLTPGTSVTVTVTPVGAAGTCFIAASLTCVSSLCLPPTVPTISTTAPTCFADGFTTIANYNAANTYTFSPAGPIASAGGTIVGATIGTAYTVTATNGGCTSAASAAFTNLIVLFTPARPTASTIAPTCAADGFTTITNYSAANTYTFLPAGPTAGAGGTITGAVIGTAYTITATSGGCSSAASTAFTNLIRLTTPAVPTISTTAPTCAADGFTIITNYSAANTYTFLPVGPTAGAGGTITGAVIGTAYTITATSGGCSSAASTAFTNLIRLTTPAVPTISTTAPTCAADGFTTITNYSAANTYTFLPAGPTAGVGGTITGATLGTAYTLTATNGGCTSAASTAFTNLIRLITPAVPTISATAPTCAADGFTIITNYSAANTYTFLPAGPTAGAGGTITGATLGTAYTITATNGGCTSATSTAFTNLIRLTTPAVPTVSTTAPTCAADGFTTITNYSAANTYTFLPTGPTAGAGGNITGATLGTAYTITSTNGGCNSASASFTNLIRLVNLATPTFSTTAPSCTADGFTTITNYIAIYTYNFTPAGPTVGIGGIITGAVIGTAYTLIATQGICTSVVSTSFTNAIMLVTPTAPTLNTAAPTCAANGSTVINNYNAANTYTFSPIGPSTGAGGSITGAVLGTAYTITATNGGCASLASVPFTDLIRLTTPVTPIASTTAPSCAADGFTTITNYNAANTYIFSPAGPTAGLGGTIIGAVIGTAYTITATNGSCTSAASVPFTNLIQLTTPVVPTILTTAPSCAANGFTTVTNYNASNTYTFSPLGPTAGVGGTIAGAAIGITYTITATSGGCTSVPSATFTNLIRLTTPAVPSVSTTAPTCSADGFTTITNYNAANNYTFSPAGPTAGLGGTIIGAVIGTAYTITATNGGCTSAASVPFTNLIQLTTPVVPTILTTAPSCAANGFTTVTNYNAANNYTFSPAGPTTNAGGIITGAVFGTAYTITATNGGCTSAASAAFTNLVRLITPAVPTLSSTQPTCTVDGFTIINNYNPANTYAFSPAGPTVGAGGTITTATFGTAYTVTANNGSCTSTASVAFTNLVRFGIPVVPAISTIAPSCTANGITAITNYDVAAIYTFTPNGPTVSAGGTISGAVIGTSYTITSSKGGCTSTASASFTNLIMLITPTLPTLSTIPPTCATDGFTTITNYNSANTYTFSPVGPTASAGGAINGANVGTAYTVTTTNSGCTSGVSVSFTNAPLLFNITTTSPQPLHFCDDNNDGNGMFDLTQLIPGIIGGNPYVVTFHETPTDAAIGGTTIPVPNSYENINPYLQTVFIRVQQSNISPCYVVIPLQLIIDLKPEATAPNDYHICDLDSDGSAIFDLTSVAPQVFGTINQSTHTITYHTSLNDANGDIGAIINVMAFPSTGQTIWIRVEDNATGCFDIVTLELIVDPLPLATQPNYPQYSLCDVTLPLAHEEFDLGSRITSILLNQTGMNVTFHFSQSDAASDINPLPLLYTNIPPFVQTLWIRVENANTGCFVLSTMDIRVEPLPTPIPPNEIYAICDNNQDGYGTFNLNSLTTDILQGANYTISYHETYDDAQSGNNALLSPYDNITPFTQFIYVLAVDNVNGCRNIIPIELRVEPQPITPFVVPNLIQCDEDASPQSGTMYFDLTQNNAAVLTIQNSAATDYTVSYHISQNHALLGVPEIIQSSHYFGANHQIIWVRVEHNISHCFSIGSFELQINAPLALSTPSPLSICDADANPNNQFTTFDLTVKDNEITGSQPNMTVTYYPSYPVTASSVAIPNPTAYTNDNIHPAVQTLGVMVTTPQGCRSYTTLDIRVLPIPVANVSGIRPLTPQCDLNNTGDMMEVFDLTTYASNIINGDLTLTLHYYPSQADALYDTNEILLPATALVGQNVWIRVENNRVDYQGNNCFVLVEQPLTVNPLPTTLTPVVVQNCDDDSDGQASFDLTTTTAAFYSTADVTITYYTTANDAQFATSPIGNPAAYLNASNPQIIYIRVVNNVTGCVNYSGQFTITVAPKPTATAPADYGTCDTDGTNDGFFALDLSTYINGVIGTQTGVNTTFYNTQNDAVNATNPITDLVNYQTYTHTIWIRVEDTTTGCYQLVSFDNTVEELAEPVIASPSDTICVEFGSNVLLSGLTLDSGITNPNYTFEWSLGGTLLTGSNATYPVTTVAPGDYTVVATSTSALGCVSYPSAPFTVIQSGPAQFSTPPYTVSNAFDDNQVITINVVGFGLYEYSLDDGPFQSSPIFEHASLGEHSIAVRDARGNTSCGEISLDGVQTINYPHYFTPNGDGFNDTWNVVGLNSQLNAKLYIFDRYGKLLKQISTNGEGWDGTFNGHALPSTDYWFKIEYLEQAAVKEFKAHFSLKR